jgi:hypothetical protein
MVSTSMQFSEFETSFAFAFGEEFDRKSNAILKR